MENKEGFIVCPKCHTKYKKPTNIPDKGISVKCKKCGDLFFVPFDGEIEYKDDFFIDSLVRKPDATIIRIKDFKDLEQKIINEDIYASDEISKDGKNWKTVGELSETKDAFKRVITPLSDVDAFFKGYFLRSTKKEVIEMKNLAELQKKIVALEVDDSFEVSKNQNSWYKLSSIGELSPFFELVKLKEGRKKEDQEFVKTEKKEVISSELSNSDSEVLIPKFEEERKEKKEEQIVKAEKKPDVDSVVVNSESDVADDDFSSLFEEEEDFDKPKKSSLKLIVSVVVLVFLAGFVLFWVLSPSKKGVEKIVQQKSNNVKKQTLHQQNSPKKAEKKVEKMEKKIVSTKKVQTNLSKTSKLQKAKKNILRQKKIKHISRAKKIASCSSLTNRGWNLIDRGKMSLALKIFKSALRKHPNCYAAYYGIGESYNELGKKQQALKNYKLFLKFSPNSKDAAEVRRIIKDFNN